jgi:hypothetical protein
MADDITKEQLAQEVLEHLLVVAVGQEPTEAVTNKAIAGVERAWSRLSENGVAPFDVDSIPDNAKDQMRDYVAGFLCTGAFGIPADRISILKAVAREAETLLAQQFENTSIDDDDEEIDTNPDGF